MENSSSSPHAFSAQDMEELVNNLQESLESLISKAKVVPGEILILGASTSEVLGESIGKGSSQELGTVLVKNIQDICDDHGLYLAVQGCEHLNRALVVSKACQEAYRLQRVNAVPALHAGGACSLAAYERLPEARMVKSLRHQAALGVDIGDTFIGMHLRPVVVPVRTSIDTLGKAHITFCRTRPPFVGGERAQYDPDLR